MALATKTRQVEHQVAPADRARRIAELERVGGKIAGAESRNPVKNAGKFEVAKIESEITHGTGKVVLTMEVDYDRATDALETIIRHPTLGTMLINPKKCNLTQEQYVKGVLSLPEVPVALSGNISGPRLLQSALDAHGFSAQIDANNTVQYIVARATAIIDAIEAIERRLDPVRIEEHFEAERQIREFERLREKYNAKDTSAPAIAEICQQGLSGIIAALKLRTLNWASAEELRELFEAVLIPKEN
ncbi:hypothetical protein HY990_06750 [Candidatus Micrarchaeota archaeon]|nr:hypothetical protein [Candidatus Micrarchaeota archaeon]